MTLRFPDNADHFQAFTVRTANLDTRSRLELLAVSLRSGILVNFRYFTIATFGFILNLYLYKKYDGTCSISAVSIMVILIFIFHFLDLFNSWNRIITILKKSQYKKVKKTQMKLLGTTN